MKETKKPKQVRVYLNEENQAMLDELVRKIPLLPESQLMTMLVSQALSAARKNHYRLPLPFVFTISEVEEDAVRSVKPATVKRI